jgi:hypothetical protein
MSEAAKIAWERISESDRAIIHRWANNSGRPPNCPWNNVRDRIACHELPCPVLFPEIVSDAGVACPCNVFGFEEVKSRCEELLSYGDQTAN